MINRVSAEVIRAPDDVEIHPEQIMVFFSAPNPSHPGSETLTIEKEKFSEANFQWISYNLLFTYKEKEKGPDYFVYQIGLNSNGTEKPPAIVFDSDSAFDLSDAKRPVNDPDPSEIKRHIAKLLKGPDLFPSKEYQTIYVNTDKSDKWGRYSSDKFKRLFDNDFYIVLNPKSSVLKNPFGAEVGLKGKEKMGYNLAVKVAMEKKDPGYMTGGRDIMKKLVKKLRSEQGLKVPERGKEYETGGFDILKKWQEKKEHKQIKGPEEGYDVMKKVKEHSAPIRKVNG